MATKLSELAVGSIVKLNVDGVAKEFIVVHQGLPSSMYDASCNGTCLLMKDLGEGVQWTKGYTNSYKSSNIRAYLDEDFFALLDLDIQEVVKQVKIPYTNGTSKTGTVDSGADGLAAKVFALSFSEVGFSKDDTSYCIEEGAKLSYFLSGTGDDANARRIAYLNGTARDWSCRTPSKKDANIISTVSHFGKNGTANCNTAECIRPALVMPKTVYVDGNGFVQIKEPSAVAMRTMVAGVEREVDMLLAGVDGVSREVDSTAVGINGVTVSQKRIKSEKRRFKR